jgi:hypothetical protein
MLANTGGMVRNSSSQVFLQELFLELGPVNIHNLLPHSRLGLEARVGIKRGSFTIPGLIPYFKAYFSLVL